MILRYKLAQLLSRKIEERAKRWVESNTTLRDHLEYYRRTSPSTGCSYSDYLSLYKYVRKYKPLEVLECGTGFSTVIITQALKENEADGGSHNWRLVSMEQSAKYYDAAMKSLPPILKNDARLEIVLSEAVEDTYEFFRGVRYNEVPKRAYDFVFVDGPDLMMHPDKQPLTFNYDFVKLVSESDHPIGAFIDTRVSTCFVYSLLFPNKFKYDYLRWLGIVEPVTKNDLSTGIKIVSRAMAKRQFRRPSIWQLITGAQ